MSNTFCPCGSGADYTNCCAPFHQGEIAPTAEKLMRSRYSAFARNQANYLVETLHPSKRGEHEKDALETVINRTTWIDLEVVSTNEGGQGDDQGQVEFIATYQRDNRVEKLHERSNFVKEDGRWYYVDGDFDPQGAAPSKKLGRNDPCWCGSGKKFKKCHGANG